VARAKVRTGMPSVTLDKAEFARRVRRRFYDPAFKPLEQEIERIIEVAWDGYNNGRKAPRTKPAGAGYADPSYELSVEWSEASKAIKRAERQQKSRSAKSRILLINGSARSDQTCPGEMSKSFRLVNIAQEVFAGERDLEVELLDLSRLTSEYGRNIHPCKACVSTAMPLCHWPCSCYPNHSLGQHNDWMNEIYPMWVAAHGVMIVTPVNWYQVPGGLKAMIDRLVCADGGNPDPTTTHGKKPEEAKRLELEGWNFPKHLAGRAFAVVVHGDTEGADTLRRSLTDWLLDMELVESGNAGTLDRYIGYYEPYATSHDALDRDFAMQEEVRNVARSLVQTVRLMRDGRRERPDQDLRAPRPK
jgi:multimeric flavodoxin WrbA